MAAARDSDAFDAIVMAEARFHVEGYQEGYAEGTHVGAIEGKQYGIQEGAKIGLEIGSYLGFSMTWLQLLQKHSEDKHSKKIKVLESLIDMIQKFPHQDPSYNKLQEDLERIRGKFKQEEDERLRECDFPEATWFAHCYMYHLISDFIQKDTHFHFEFGMNGEEGFNWI